MAEGLTAEQIEFFEKNGYLTIPDFWTRETCDRLKRRAGEILEAFDVDSHRSVFTTNDQTRKTDDYFLRSGGNISYFFEERAFDTEGRLTVPKEQCVNKIGHAMHDLDPLFQECTYEPRVQTICKQLLKRPSIVQSMYIFKQPRIGGEVGAHQDGTFLYTLPQSVVGFWWALEDCTTDNGCLWAVPGSHTIGVKRWFRRSPTGEGSVFEPAEVEPFDLTGAVPLEVTAGTLVLLHNALVHYSCENRSDKSRHAYSVHVVETEGCEYPAANWLQRPADFPFRVL